MGQFACFIEFLGLTGLWSRWKETCPLACTSPKVPGIADVPGTLMLSILAGHKRYSHVTVIRGYQTLINDTLRRVIESGHIEADLRRVIREELRQDQPPKGAHRPGGISRPDLTGFGNLSGPGDGDAAGCWPTGSDKLTRHHPPSQRQRS